MDSARPDVLEFYRQRGAKIIDLAHDQDSTDLHKCLAYIEKRYSEAELRQLTILVLGELQGCSADCQRGHSSMAQRHCTRGLCSDMLDPLVLGTTSHSAFILQEQ